MNNIYRQAVITIIAACGADPFYGLRGVSSRRRQGTPSLSIANVQFIQGLPYVYQMVDRIRYTRWNKRAWTYQEVVFSRVRLIFTDEEVCFDCPETCGFEIYNFSHVEADKNSVLSRLPQRYINKAWDPIKHITTYSERVLGHPEDVIKALSGVLNACEVDKSFTHYWGIPILAEEPDKAKPLIRSPILADTFWRGLQWQLVNVSRSKRAKRRSFGPSWSWAGWEGNIHWTQAREGITESVLSQDRTAGHDTESLNMLHIELMDGRVIGWKEFMAYDKAMRQSLLSNFVHVTAVTTPVCVKISRRYPDTYEVEMEHSTEKDQNSVIIGFQPNVGGPVPRDCEAIHLSPLRKPSGYYYDSLLSLLIVGTINGHLERIGIADMCFDDYLYSYELRGHKHEAAWQLASENIRSGCKGMLRVQKTLRLG
jgi:hypothetical protein